MIPARLDDRVSYGFQVVPAYQTQITPLDNGKEQRNANRTRARRSFTCRFTTFDKASFALLLAMYHAAKGAAYAFLFRDWTDFQATAEALGNTPGANQTPVQLVKTYTNGAFSTVRTITKPRSTGFTLYSNGVAKAGTLDTTTGLFTPTTNWAVGEALTWTGVFDVPVRFATDDMPSTYENYRHIQTALTLIEVFDE